MPPDYLSVSYDFDHTSGMARSIPGIAGNYGNDGKFHKSHQIHNQTKRSINKLCLGKLSCYKTVRIEFSVHSGFSSKPYYKKRKHGNTGNQHTKLSKSKSTHC